MAWQTFDLLCENLRSEAELQVLLGLLPESKGGVGVLALGLLSKNKRRVTSYFLFLSDMMVLLLLNSPVDIG